MATSKAWKKIAASAMALALVFGVAGTFGAKSFIGSDIAVFAAEEETLGDTGPLNSDERYDVVQSEGGTVEAELTEDEESIIITATPDEDYILSRVLVNGEQVAINDNDEYVISLDYYEGQDITISAEFSEDFGVTIGTASHGYVGYKTYEDDDGEMVFEIVVEPEDGYAIDKVLVNGEQIAVNDQGKYVIDIPSEPITIGAEFVKVTYNIDTAIEGGSLVDEVVTDEEGSAVKITPVPNDGYVFVMLLVNGDQAAVNDNGEYLIALSDDEVADITAIFTKGEIEVEEPANGSLTYEMLWDDEDGAAIRVTATPDEGFEIEGVYINDDQVAVNDDGEYVIGLNAYRDTKVVLSAVFKGPEMITVDQTANGSVDYEMIQDDNGEFTAVKVIPTPDAGYRVDKVLINGEQMAINDQGEYLLEFPSDPIVISAEFVKMEEPEPAPAPSKDAPAPAPGKDSVPKTGAAAAGIAAITAAAAAAIVIGKKKK